MAKRPTHDFSSGHDLTFREPLRGALLTVRSLLRSLSLSFSLSASSLLTLSQNKEINIKNNDQVVLMCDIVYTDSFIH